MLIVYFTCSSELCMNIKNLLLCTCGSLAKLPFIYDIAILTNINLCRQYKFWKKYAWIWDSGRSKTFTLLTYAQKLATLSIYIKINSIQIFYLKLSKKVNF